MEVTQNLNDWKIDQCEALLDTLDSIMLIEEVDKSMWTLNAMGSFMVRFFYRYLTKKVTRGPLG